MQFDDPDLISGRNKIGFRTKLVTYQFTINTVYHLITYYTHIIYAQ